MGIEFDPIRVLQEMGVTPETCFLENAHTLGGTFTAKPVTGFDYRTYSYPWDGLDWFKSTTGGGDGRGHWKGGYLIDLRKTPPSFQDRVLLASNSQKEAEQKLDELIEECDRRAQEARADAVQELDIDSHQQRVLKAFQTITGFLVPGR